MKLILLILFILMPSFVFSESTNVRPGDSDPIGQAIWDSMQGDFNRWPPRVPEFSRNVNTASANANAEWMAMSLEERGRHIYNMANNLIDMHNFRYGPENFRYSPRVLTCKNYNESTFNPNIQAGSSSGVGISQVLDGTSEDTFDRYGHIFRSVVPGFENVTDGLAIPHREGFNYRMVNSIGAQVEMGLFVMHAKSLDHAARVRQGNGVGIRSVKCLLENYFGSTHVVDGRRVRNRRANKQYAIPIFNCAVCMANRSERGQEPVAQECLDKAKTPATEAEIADSMERDRC